MNESFHVGEIAIFFDPEYLGHLCEVEIVSELRPSLFYLGELAHDIRDPSDGATGVAKPSQLRKKKPPSTDIEETRQKGAPKWSQCPWQPEVETV